MPHEPRSFPSLSQQHPDISAKKSHRCHISRCCLAYHGPSGSASITLGTFAVTSPMQETIFQDEQPWPWVDAMPAASVAVRPRPGLGNADCGSSIAAQRFLGGGGAERSGPTPTLLRGSDMLAGNGPASRVCGRNRGCRGSGSGRPGTSSRAGGSAKSGRKGGSLRPDDCLSGGHGELHTRRRFASV